MPSTPKQKRAQSYDLQRVLEGEKAQRSDAARRLRVVEKQLAAVRQPGGPTPTLAFASSSPLVLGPAARLPPEGELEGRRRALAEEVSRHSGQVRARTALSLVCVWGGVVLHSIHGNASHVKAEIILAAQQQSNAPTASLATLVLDLQQPARSHPTHTPQTYTLKHTPGAGPAAAAGARAVRRGVARRRCRRRTALDVAALGGRGARDAQERVQGGVQPQGSGACA